MDMPKASSECTQLMKIVKEALDECRHNILGGSEREQAALVAIRRMGNKRGKCNMALSYIMSYSLESPSYHSLVCRPFATRVYEEAKKALEG